MDNGKTITAYVRITGGKVIYNDNLLFENAVTDAGVFFNELYRTMHINYPKFFRMDNLCKTVFLATEVLLKDISLRNKYKSEEIAVVFSNASSSLDADIKYYQSSLHAPSPALFVYTLPNVAIGEICIRQGIKGETACFVFDIFDSLFQTWYTDMLLDDNNTNACISGWADFYDGRFEAFFYLAEKNNYGAITHHNADNIDKIYNKLWKS